jgi:hypothetical protein
MRGRTSRPALGAGILSAVVGLVGLVGCVKRPADGFEGLGLSLEGRLDRITWIWGGNLRRRILPEPRELGLPYPRRDFGPGFHRVHRRHPPGGAADHSRYPDPAADGSDSRNSATALDTVHFIALS